MEPLNPAWTKDIERVYSFHTKRAPGIVVAISMVDYARELLGEVKGALCAVAETEWCLPDAIQVLTGATIGNRYLRVDHELGRYALTLYDRETGRGARVWVDVAKIDADETPELYRFFTRTRSPETASGPARKASNARVVAEFLTADRKILSTKMVHVREVGKQPIPPASVCLGCGESFLVLSPEQTRCSICRGDSYFD
ncbi:MAG: FmdE family protein [Candidatus Ozemobacteraceae bacterium]